MGIKQTSRTGFAYPTCLIYDLYMGSSHLYIGVKAAFTISVHAVSLG